MAGIATTAYSSPQKHVTPPYLSQNGTDIDIYKPLKYSKYPTIATQNDSMILQKVSLIARGFLFWYTVQYIRLCADNEIVFNPDEFHFVKDNVEFVGFDISSRKYKRTQKLLAGIREFKSPTNISQELNLSLV